MRKTKINRNYLELGIYIVIAACIIILFEKTVGNISDIINIIRYFLDRVMRMIRPFIYAVIVAYFINSPMKQIEIALSSFKSLDRLPKLKRSLAIIFSYIIFIGVALVTVAYLLHEIVRSIVSIANNLQYTGRTIRIGYNSFIEEGVKSFIDTINSALSSDYTISDVLNSILDAFTKIVRGIPSFMNNILTGAVSFAYNILNYLLGMVIAFYILFDKENIKDLTKKILFVFLNKKYAKYIIEISCSSNNIFEKFLIGKLLDSMIVGILFFFVSAIMKLPYPPLLSLLIGITNMIPFFGPFIGAVPVVLIVMLSNMSLALWTVLVIFVLQQFDGIVIGPKILGDSTGLKPMQVILAITLGGFFGGILGMFLGVPVFAVIWNMFMNIIDSRYESKKID